MRRFSHNSIGNSPRRGAILVWFIVAFPVLLTLLCVLLEVANLYLARTELHSALEAASQAAVKDWAENFASTAGDTRRARRVGNAFAIANTINGVPVNLLNVDDNAFPLNYDAAEACNDNACSSGVFMFGAVTDNGSDFVFNCCQTPTCGTGTVLIDATGQGNLKTAANNQWGIRFLDEPEVPSTTLITRITITMTGNAFFIPPFEVADNTANPFKVNDSSGNLAPDIVGLSDAQISESFQPIGPVPNKILVLDFSATLTDVGFEKGDRFRFGLGVGRGNGNAQVDGDGVGQPGTQAVVLVEFSTGATASGALIDTSLGGNPVGSTCLDPGNYDAIHQSLAVVPLINPIPDLPCPPGPTNQDGQSYVQLQGGGGGFLNAFAVRAQATYEVPSICCEIFGIPVGPFSVTARADALYDCVNGSPRLYHLKPANFLCNVACP